MSDTLPNDVNEFDLDKGQALIPGKNEKPEHIIGFCRVSIGHSTDLKAHREEVKTGESIASQVNKMILRLNKNIDNRSCDGHFLSAEEKKLFEKRHQDRMVDEVKLDTTAFKKKYGPLIEIDRPTLLVFVIWHHCNVRFAENYIVPRYPSTDLDPNCSGVRLWKNGCAMGWYSKYRDGEQGSVEGEFWYDLVVEDTVSTNGEPTPLRGQFDPGNGNNGSINWPQLDVVSNVQYR